MTDHSVFGLFCSSESRFETVPQTCSTSHSETSVPSRRFYCTCTELLTSCQTSI